MCLLFVYVNYRGSAETGKAGSVITVSKITAIGIFVLFGLAAIWRGGTAGEGLATVPVAEKFTPFLPIPDPQVSCSMTEKVPFVMEYARSVTTFKDFSEMFIVWTTGWLCGTPGDPGQASYDGFAEGEIVGGTGRFEGASCEVTTSFSGFDMAGPIVIGGPEFPSFGSWKGTIEGKVVFAD